MKKMEPIIVQSAKEISLVDFLEALGCKPSFRDGDNIFYKPPYSPDAKEATLVVNSVSNKWRDLSTQTYGEIYDLAYELTGSCNIRELNLYIHTQMQKAEVCGCLKEKKVCQDGGFGPKMKR